MAAERHLITISWDRIAGVTGHETVFLSTCAQNAVIGTNAHQVVTHVVGYLWFLAHA